MKYCNKCMYPETSQPTIYFDNEGVCSGCRYDESRKDDDVDWKHREEQFRSIVESAKKDRKKRNAPYDCIIPVSGGKDSHFQVWICTQIYGLKPLLVTYNHGFNNPVGNLNFTNLVVSPSSAIFNLFDGEIYFTNSILLLFNSLSIIPLIRK